MTSHASDQAGGTRRRATIKDIAARLGVSYTSVSRALSDHPHTSAALKARVREVAAELNYIPNSGARSLHAGRSRMIGLLIPDVGNQLFAAMASMLAERCRHAGYQLILAVSEGDPVVEFQQLTALEESRVAGIIIAACGDSLPETLHLLARIPVVQLARRNTRIEAPIVATHDREGAYKAVRHLLDLGHERIGLIGGTLELGTNRDRVEGARQAAAEAGATLQDEGVLLGPLTAEFGHAAMSRLLQSRKPPTAILATHSLLALGAVEALRQANVDVPRSLSFIGFGDPEWYRLWGAGVTAVSIPIQAMAESAIFHLLAQIQGPRGGGETYQVTLDTHLILRGSTGPAPADRGSGPAPPEGRRSAHRAGDL